MIETVAGTAHLRDQLLVGYLFLAVMVGTNLPTPLYVLYAQRLRLTSLDITAIYGVYAVCVLATLLLAGRLSDHAGRRPVLLLAVVIAGLGELVLMTTSDLAGLLAGRIAAGVAAGLVIGTGTAYLADLASDRPARANAFATIANMGGQAVGTLLAGVLAVFFIGPTVTPYAAGLFLLVPVLLVPVRRLPETRLSGGGWRAGVKLQSVRVPASIRTPFLAAALGLLAAFALLGFMTALSGLLLTERLHDQSLLISGLATFTLFASAAAAQLRAVGSSPPRAMLFGLAALPAGAGLLLIADLAASTAALFCGAIVTGAGVGAVLRAALAMVTAVCPPDHRSEVVSALFAAVYLGASVPTIAAGLTATLADLQTAVIAVGGFVTFLVILAAGMIVRLGVAG
jgi:MFS family permease